MARFGLTDFEFDRIRPLLPDKPRGVARVDDRRVLNGIFWVLRTGSPWRDLSERYGPYTTVYNRFNRWAEAGSGCASSRPWPRRRRTACSSSTPRSSAPTSRRRRKRGDGTDGPKQPRSGSDRWGEVASVLTGRPRPNIPPFFPRLRWTSVKISYISAEEALADRASIWRCHSTRCSSDISSQATIAAVTCLGMPLCQCPRSCLEIVDLLKPSSLPRSL